MNPTKVGTVAVCSAGRVGIVLGRKKLPWGESWVGLAIDRISPLWASRNPNPVADSLPEYEEQCLIEYRAQAKAKEALVDETKSPLATDADILTSALAKIVTLTDERDALQSQVEVMGEELQRRKDEDS